MISLKKYEKQNFDSNSRQSSNTEVQLEQIYIVSQKIVSQNIFHHSSNTLTKVHQNWETFVGLSKLIKVIDNDPLHLIISEHHLGMSLPHITDVGQSL